MHLILRNAPLHLLTKVRQTKPCLRVQSGALYAPCKASTLLYFTPCVAYKAPLCKKVYPLLPPVQGVAELCKECAFGLRHAKLRFARIAPSYKAELCMQSKAKHPLAKRSFEWVCMGLHGFAPEVRMHLRCNAEQSNTKQSFVRTSGAKHSCLSSTWVLTPFFLNVEITLINIYKKSDGPQVMS